MKVMISVPKQHFDKYGVEFPEDWKLVFLSGKVQPSDAEANPDTDILMTSSDELVDGPMMDKMPGLKMIHVEGVGFDKIDLAAAKERGIPVCNNRAVNNVAVAEHTVGLIISALRRVPQNCSLYKQIGFLDAKRKFHERPENELAGKTVGLVGLGAIGREVAKRLTGWDVDLVYYDAFRQKPEAEAAMNIRFMELDDLCRSADVISLHVPVLPSTIKMFNKERFAMMKPNALLVNTARGEIIDNDALAEALENEVIYGAALDVISPEPIPRDHVLLNLSEKASDRLVITTHTAGMTDEAFRRMVVNALANMKRIERGEEPVNIVNR